MTPINGTTWWLLNRVKNVLNVLFSWREVQSLSFTDSCKHALENLVMPNFTCNKILIIVKTGNINNTSEVKTALFFFCKYHLSAISFQGDGWVAEEQARLDCLSLLVLSPWRGQWWRLGDHQHLFQLSDTPPDILLLTNHPWGQMPQDVPCSSPERKDDLW